MGSKYLMGAVAAGLATLAFSTAALAKCGEDYSWKYVNGRDHKAFAMTAPASHLSPNYHGISYSCAWSVGQPTRQIAIRLALARCESVRVRNDRKGACRVAKAQ